MTWRAGEVGVCESRLAIGAEVEIGDGRGATSLEPIAPPATPPWKS